MECKTIRVRGVTIGYREGGSGPPVVLLHGVGESSFGHMPHLEQPQEFRRLVEEF